MGGGTIKYGDMFYNIKTKTLYKNNKKIELTPLENELLVLFFKNKNRYIPKCEILERFEITDGSLRVKLSNIRKLGFEIINNREYGYQLKEKK
jgi:DNA-binding response OmpR family regulator